MSWIIGLIALSAASLISALPFDGDGEVIPFDDQLLLGAPLVGDTKMTKFSLPTNLEPKSYELHVEPDLGKAEFSGKVKITVDVSIVPMWLTLNTLGRILFCEKVNNPSLFTGRNCQRHLGRYSPTFPFYLILFFVQSD